MSKFKWMIYAVLFCAGAAFVTLNQGQPWHRVYCSVILPLINWPPSVSGFFSCSNVVQAVKTDYSRNMDVGPEEGQPGFQVYRPRDGAQPAVFRMTVKRDRQFMFFFPRLQGDDSRIEVYEVADEFKRKLITVRGDKLWSPIGRRYELNLGCVEHGLNSEAYDVVLEFVLVGRWTQIWAKDLAILF